MVTRLSHDKLYDRTDYSNYNKMTFENYDECNNYMIHDTYVTIGNYETQHLYSIHIAKNPRCL